MIATDVHDQVYGHAKDLADELAAFGLANAHDRVRDWIRRGLVTKIADFDGRPIYALADLQAAELATRRHGKRRRPLDKALAIAHALH